MKVAIYLAGPIQKGHEAIEEHWSDQEKDELKQLLSNFQVSFLNPAHRTDSLSDPQSIFGRDMLQVASADLVFVDARGRRGLGVGAEMMWAKYHAIPVVTWAPKETHYKKTNASLLGVPVSNYVHPFIHSLSDVIVDTLSQAADWTYEYMHGKIKTIKDMPHIFHTVAHYVDTQLKQDIPMNKLLLQDERLSKKLDLLLHRTQK